MNALNDLTQITFRIEYLTVELLICAFFDWVGFETSLKKTNSFLSKVSNLTNQKMAQFQNQTLRYGR
jgi:hypothetical protein